MSERRLVPKAYRHVFTLQADEIIRAEYHRMLHGRRPYSVKKFLGAKLGVPGWVAMRRATELGVSRVKEPRWSDAELSLLTEHAWKNPNTITRIFKSHGFQRSVAAIHIMVTRRLGGRLANRTWYSGTQLATLLGIDRHLVLRWISSGLLSAKQEGAGRNASQSCDIHKIRNLDFRRFVATNPHVIDLRKVDQLWFIDLLTNYRVNAIDDHNEELKQAHKLEKSS